MSIDSFDLQRFWTRRFIWFILVFLMLPTGRLCAASLPNVAVMTLQAKGVTANDADVITDGLIASLQQNGSMRVMERSQMDQILKEQGFAKSGACDAAECAIEVGKFLSVDRILVGSVGILGKTYTLNLRTVNVSTGEVLKSTLRSRAGNIEDVLTVLVPESVNDLVSVPKSNSLAGPTSGASAPASAGQPGAAKPEPVKKSTGSSWGWWVGGGTVVLAGTAAAILLLDKKSETSTPVEPVVSTTTLKTSW